MSATPNHGRFSCRDTDAMMCLPIKRSSSSRGAGHLPGALAAFVIAFIGLPCLASDTVRLTPAGAQWQGNADGTIPAWDGGLTQAPRGWQADRGYLDPFPTDKPQFNISAQNSAAYRDKLSPGIQAMLRGYPDFRMPVYVTRRTASLPQGVTDTAHREAAGIRVSGDTLLGRQQSAIPFPTPRTGTEVMWNHRLRYRGGSSEHEEYWYPVRDGKIQVRTAYAQKLAENNALDTPTANGIVFVRAHFMSPPVLSHTTNFVHETIDANEDSRNWWVLNDGQKRARRLTAAGYDDMPLGVDDLRTRDQLDGFNGALDRYDWKLVGKREMYVPYNTYKLSDARLSPEHVMGPHSVKADFMRYELHRVWVVDAELKPGMRHIYARRTFYVDEDSWAVLLEDAYDSRGNLWRVGVHGLVQFYDVQVPGYRVNIWHDLTNGAYLATGLEMESKKPRQFGVKATLAEFSPEMGNNKEGGAK